MFTSWLPLRGRRAGRAAPRLALPAEPGLERGRVVRWMSGRRLARRARPGTRSLLSRAKRAWGKLPDRAAVDVTEAIAASRVMENPIPLAAGWGWGLNALLAASELHGDGAVLAPA